jgi:hypothetical protein
MFSIVNSEKFAEKEKKNGKITYTSVEFKNFLVKLVPQASILFNLLFDGGLCGFHGFHHLKQAVVVVGSGGGAGAGGDSQA